MKYKNQPFDENIKDRLPTNDKFFSRSYAVEYAMRFVSIEFQLKNVSINIIFKAIFLIATYNDGTSFNDDDVDSSYPSSEKGCSRHQPHPHPLRPPRQ